MMNQFFLSLADFFQKIMTIIGRFFSDDKQVDNFIKLLIVSVLLILVIAIVFSLVVNPESLNVEKNQLIVVVITTILNGFTILVYKYFKSNKQSKHAKSES